MASSVAGHRRAFGSDTVPGVYEDLELADLVVLTGSNLAWSHPVLYQRLAAAKEARPAMKIVVIDPRRTATCDIADLHLAIAPGSDAALFNAVLVTIAKDGTPPAHATGYADAVAAARACDPAQTGLDPALLAEFCAQWAATEKVVTVYSQGINQSATWTDKVNAILNCHLATGRIGRPGMGPFSVTGQPNAMGGREVGGLANMLACHLDIENPAHRDAVQTFWASPAMAQKPGLKAVCMFRAVGEPYVQIHPADAARLGLGPADLVHMRSDRGQAILRALITDAVAESEVFAPMHWTGENAALARIDALIPGEVDPISGQPASKSAAVHLTRFAAAWYAFAVCATDIAPNSDYWAKARVAGGWRLELAGAVLPLDWPHFAGSLFGLIEPPVMVTDTARGLTRLAWHRDDRLIAALFVGPAPVALARDHLVAQLGAFRPVAVLSGKPGADQPDPGPTICACMNVGRNTILQAIEAGTCSVAALSTLLGAGTSCGSCRPALNALLALTTHKEAAE